MDYAKRYIHQVRETFDRDAADCDYAATRAVIFNLAAAMLIKDLVFTAELATSPEKYARDRVTYNVHPTNGDRMIVEFDQIGRGLMIGRSEPAKPVVAAADVPLGGFQIADSDERINFFRLL